jgi:ribosomal-protein-alanine N-acetyltransferase
MWSWRVNEDSRVSADASSLHVRRAQADESLEAVAQLQRTSFTNPWSVESITWELRETDVARLYLLEAGDQLLAYCACWVIFDELHINSLAVAPEARRRGHARLLLTSVFEDVRPAGVTGATLEVRRSNVAAVGLYEGLGFRVEGVRLGYYQEPIEDALVLWHRHLAGGFR